MLTVENILIVSVYNNSSSDWPRLQIMDIHEIKNASYLAVNSMIPPIQKYTVSKPILLFRVHKFFSHTYHYFNKLYDFVCKLNWHNNVAKQIDVLQFHIDICQFSSQNKTKPVFGSLQSKSSVGRSVFIIGKLTVNSHFLLN